MSGGAGADWERPPGRAVRRWLPPVLLLVALLTAPLWWRAGPPTDPPLTVAPSPEPAQPSEPPVGGGATIGPVEVGSPDAVGPQLPGDPDITVVAADDRGLRFVDVADGEVRRTELPQGDRVPRAGTMFAVGDHLVIGDGSRTVRLDADGGAAVELSDEGAALTTFDDDTVWVVEPFTAGRAGTATRLSLSGEVVEQVRYPAVGRPVAGLDAGVVVSTPSGVALVAGERARTLTSGGALAAVDEDQLAWTDCTPELRCSLVIGSIDQPNGVRSPIAADELPGGYANLPTGRFSPDGRWLALPVFRVNPRGGLESPAVAIIDTATGTEVGRAPGPSVNTVRASAVAWSPDSRWLFVGGGIGIRAWSVQRRAVFDLRIGPGIVRALVAR